DFLEHGIYKNYVFKKAVEIWKQLDDGQISWYLGKRQVKLSIDQLELMIQMHSYLVENVKSELNHIDQTLRQEDFLSIFNKITSSMNNGTDLFNDDSASFSEEVDGNIEEDIEEDMEEDMEEPSEEDSVGKNLLTLEIENFISLSSKLKSNKLLTEDIVHGNRDFDVNDLINSLD
ncbi:6164_t:CDS:2, partial [Cetraspora pellucida]